MSVTLL